MRTLLPAVVRFFRFAPAIVALHSSVAEAQMVLSTTRQLSVPCGYQELLGRLEGEAPAREMFASQHVELTSFQLRKPADSDSAPSSHSADKAAVHADIDITGCSHEFGSMAFVMHIQATNEIATIDVSLQRPVGLFRAQKYTYAIEPIGEDVTSIKLTHMLDVKLELRRLRVVNDLIRRITRERATEQLCQLTNRMSQTLNQIASTTPDVPTTEGKASDTDQDKEDSSVSESKKQTADDPIAKDDGTPKENASKEMDSVESLPEDSEHKPVTKLTITVKKIKGGKGEIRLAIFNTQADFKSYDARKEDEEQGKAFRRVAKKVDDKSEVVFEFDDVPPGKYAFAAFHDQDANQKLTSSFLGLPSEPYGFSRDARGQLGAPAYDAALIEFDAEHASFEFSIK